MPAADGLEKPARRRPGRIPVSCAECRRLKLKCDRNRPCETCVKRGCASICPDGLLSSGKGNRLVLANTENLHDHIDTLVNRIRQLEDGLASLQTRVSTERHPLLSDDLLQLKNSGPTPSPLAGGNTSGSDSRKRTPDSVSLSPTSTESVKEEHDLLDSFGTLHIGVNGSTQYLGKTARPDHILGLTNRPENVHRSLPRLTVGVLQSASMGNDYYQVKDDVKQTIYNLLPSLDEAYELCEIYLEHENIHWDGITRTRLFDGLVTPIYNSDISIISQSPQEVSLLLLVFSLACLFDPNRTPNSVEAEEYYVLSRAAINCSNIPFLSMPTLISIEITLHCGYYLEYSGQTHRAWLLFCLAGVLGHSVGLHLSPARWNLEDSLADRRRRLFWNLWLADFTSSTMFGRPPIISLGAFDVEFPHDPEETVNSLGQREPGFRHWLFGFFKIVGEGRPSHVFKSKPLPYSSILELDKRIRDFPIPEKFSFANTIEADIAPSARLRFQGWSIMCSKELSLLYLHRAYLVSALSRPSSPKPDSSQQHRRPVHNSIDGKYGPSVVAAYQSAHTIIQSLKLVGDSMTSNLLRPELSEFGAIPAMSSAIVMAFIVTGAPGTNLAGPALADLEEVYALYECAVEKHVSTSASSLEVIEKLLRKSRAYLDWYRAYGQTNSRPPPTDWIGDLDQLSGKTHLVVADSEESVDYSSSTARDMEGRPSQRLTLDFLHPSIARDLPMLGLSPTQTHPPPPPQPQPYRPSPQYLSYPQQWQTPSQLPFAMPGTQPSGFAYMGDAYNTYTAVPSVQSHDAQGENVVDPSMQMYSGLFSSDDRILEMLDPTWQAFMQQLGF